MAALGRHRAKRDKRRAADLGGAADRLLRYGHEDDPNNGCELAPVDFVAVAQGFGITAEHVIEVARKL